MSMSREKVIENLRKRMDVVNNHYETAPEKFLEAWKEAVNKIGWSYFKCKSGFNHPVSVDAATNKWQLTPSYELMLQRLNTCSVGEGVFMGVIYSFYNSDTSEQFLHAFDMRGLGDVSSRLDLDELDIVTRLMFNHTGW